MVGVGVVFYLMAALRARLNVDCDMSQYLDLTALGTIADCAPMDEVNRTLVGGGLRRLRAGGGGESALWLLLGGQSATSERLHE